LNEKGYDGYKSAIQRQQILFFQSSRVKSNPRQREIVTERMFMYIFITFAQNDWIQEFIGSEETNYIRGLVTLSAMDY
jgi:hypothetical protein